MTNMNDAAAIALHEALQRQQEAFVSAPSPSVQQRREDLRTLARMLGDHRDALVAAVHQDYGNRSAFETLFAEFLVVIDTPARATA
jgi:coniferyl-aldehyde dehydrogenase